MRVLHVVKTADGATWAARQVQVLTSLGVDVHVALPSLSGETIPYWTNTGATLHVADCSLPVGAPGLVRQATDRVRRLVDEIAPDLIHSHFVTTTLMLRLALGKRHAVPRLFQVPGPLHLEHLVYRRLDLASAGPADIWIASSRYTERIYHRVRIASSRLYLSYYGTDVSKPTGTTIGSVRSRLGIPNDVKIVGNINYMYAPKYYLGHRIGLKGHEFVIDALAVVLHQRSDVVGVFVGGQWGEGHAYEDHLKRLALRKCGDRAIFAGRVPSTMAASLWPDFSCAVHTPISENCGGVVEPLLNQVPTIASNAGGLPEVVLDGITGRQVPVGHPPTIAKAILETLNNQEQARWQARIGQRLVQEMFDVERTGREVFAIYQNVLGQASRPLEYDSRQRAVWIRETNQLETKDSR